jgi:hypothetical protein
MGWVMFLAGLATIVAREEIGRRFRHGRHQGAQTQNEGQLFLVIGLVSAIGGLIVIVLNLEA